MSRLVAMFCVASVAGIAAQANQAGPAGASPTFEVASIRPIGPVTGVGPVLGSVGFPPGGQFVAQNIQFVALVRAAYPNLGSSHQIVGGPDWIRTQIFDINAKATGDPPRARLTEMLTHLLADRFQLKVHTEQRELDAYALVLARRDRRFGPGLRSRAIDCEASRRPEPPECTWSSTVVNGVVRFAGRGQPLSRLVAHLQANVDRAVADRTGLLGRFDFELEHALLAAPATTDQAAEASPILTAIREQLGLRLQSRKERMNVLVIDHVEMPSPN